MMVAAIMYLLIGVGVAGAGWVRYGEGSWLKDYLPAAAFCIAWPGVVAYAAAFVLFSVAEPQPTPTTPTGDTSDE